MLEVLHGFLVRLGCPSGGKGSEIAALSGLGIFLPGVQTILAGFEFPNHWNLLQRARIYYRLLALRVRLAFTAAL